MIRSLPLLAALFILSDELRTDYARERALRIEMTTHMELETTSFEMLRDGEPVDSPFGGGDQSTEIDHKLVQVDEVLENDAGRPTRVRRAFETLSAGSSMQFGDQYRDSHHDGPLAGVTLEISLQDGVPVAEVVDGEEPDDDALLEGHALTLSLDALLPEDAVEAGGSWELESEAILRALGLDLQRVLFARPPGDEEAADGEEGRGRGGRGGPGGRSFGGGMSLLTNTEWEGQATLDGASEDHEGIACAVINLEIKGEGSVPEGESGSGSGGRGRERSFSPGSSASGLLDNKHEIELEGRLLFSTDEGRPVLLELEGTVRTESRSERSRGESTMTISTSREGALEIRVLVGSVAAEGAATGEEKQE